MKLIKYIIIAPNSSGPGGAVNPFGGARGGAPEVFQNLASKTITAAFSESV